MRDVGDAALAHQCGDVLGVVRSERASLEGAFVFGRILGAAHLPGGIAQLLGRDQAGLACLEFKEEPAALDVGAGGIGHILEHVVAARRSQEQAPTRCGR